MVTIDWHRVVLCHIHMYILWRKLLSMTGINTFDAAWEVLCCISGLRLTKRHVRSCVYLAGGWGVPVVDCSHCSRSASLDTRWVQPRDSAAVRCSTADIHHHVTTDVCLARWQRRLPHPSRYCCVYCGHPSRPRYVSCPSLHLSVACFHIHSGTVLPSSIVCAMVAQ